MTSDKLNLDKPDGQRGISSQAWLPLVAQVPMCFPTVGMNGSNPVIGSGTTVDNETSTVKGVEKG